MAGPRGAPGAGEAPRNAGSGARVLSRWDPKTGRGDVIHYEPSGDRMRTCFHCRYPGYTGGLVIGNENGSGMGFYPHRPIRGFRWINVFCAQDESIWDLGEEREYTYGWSENFGTGADGARLAYYRGRVLRAGPEQVVLQSENRGGCYRVTKVAYTRAGVRWWILATRIQNTCGHPVRFHFFTGDDPWIGRYRSSDGDVGWFRAGPFGRVIRVPRELALAPGAFTAGGMQDLGNPALGQRAARFSGQANALLLDPALPLPDFVAFANGFAHGSKDVRAHRPLDNKSPTALNLGWRAQRLAPGEGLTVAMALGLAPVARPGAVPGVLRVTDADWSAWRRYLRSGGGQRGIRRHESAARRRPPRVGRGAAVRPGVGGLPTIRFAAEWVRMTLRPGSLEVEAEYVFENRLPGPVALRIAYPVLSGQAQPPPGKVVVDGAAVAVPPLRPGVGRPVSGSGARPRAPYPQAVFPVHLAGRSIRRVRIGYAQELLRQRAGYLVSSALRWPEPLRRAVFEVRVPHAWRGVRLSYPPTSERRDGPWRVLRIVRQPFRPDRELIVSWNAPGHGAQRRRGSTDSSPPARRR